MAQVFTEDFPDPLGGYWSRWLYMNSNINSYYHASGSSADPNYRGNNPAGLWIADTQGFNSGVGGPTAVINFNPGFGAGLASLTFGVECFVSSRVEIFDMSNNVLASSVFSGGDFGFGHEDIITAVSSNGIGGFSITATNGVDQIEGNTSVDNFSARAVPEPATIAVLGLGVAALLRRRRK
jgi:hypothetical protein